MDKIRNVHDKFFAKVFSNTENIRSFLKIALPDPVLEKLDFSSIEFDFKSYITGEIKGFSSDMVVKLKMQTEDEKPIDTDIYFLFEHKSYRDKKIYIQLLKYMYLMWQKDLDNGDPLRLIIPIVFYHGKAKWKMSQSFNDQFAVNEEVKKFLLNYKYILFNTNNWDLEDKRNEKLRDNLNLTAYLFLMKSSFEKGLDSIKKVIDFWHRKDLIGNTDLLMSSLNYIVSIKDIKPDELIEILKEREVQGGEIMPSLAQRWMEQGFDQGVEEGWIKGKKEGIKEGKEVGIKVGREVEKLETAKKLIKNGVAMDIIVRATGIPKKELEKMAEKAN
jgi:predicted transposase/invertase (TIGR01784 family)